MKRNKVCDTPNNIMNLKTFAQSERSQARRGSTATPGGWEGIEQGREGGSRQWSLVEILEAEVGYES